MLSDQESQDTPNNGETMSVIEPLMNIEHLGAWKVGRNSKES